MGGNTGRATSTSRTSSSRLRSAATVAATLAAARLPFSRASASAAPPCLVTDSCTSTPPKLVFVTVTPVLLSWGISAARLPLLSGRASTATPVLAVPCSARRREASLTSMQSGVVAWHASSSNTADWLASCQGKRGSGVVRQLKVGGMAAAERGSAYLAL